MVITFAVLLPPSSDAAPYGATYSLSPTPAVCGGQANSVDVTVTNTGTLTWDPQKFSLSYHWYLGPQVYIFDGLRTPLPQPLGPNQKVTIQAAVHAPNPASFLLLPNITGPLTLKWDMVQEGVTWFSQQGVPTGDQGVTFKSNTECLDRHFLLTRVYPRITNGPKVAEPESVIILGGERFGKSAGKVLLKWDDPGGEVKLEILAWHDNVVGARVPAMSGVVDYAASLVLVTASGARSTLWPVKFLATRNLLWLPDTAVQATCSQAAWRNRCNSVGDPPLGLGFHVDRAATFSASHQSGVDFAQGTDAISATLANGWVLHNHDLWGTRDRVSLSGFAEGSPSATVRLFWTAGNFFDIVRYGVNLTIIGPKGVPYK